MLAICDARVQLVPRVTACVAYFSSLRSGVCCIIQDSDDRPRCCIRVAALERPARLNFAADSASGPAPRRGRSH